MNKPSAIERELNVIIVLNNKKDSIQNQVEQIRQDEEMETREPTNTNTYTLEGQIVTGRDVKDIKYKLEKEKDKFLIKDRINETDTDIFETILNYNKETLFCKLSRGYIYDTIYDSDFVIFINNGINDSDYKPMCIAFIEIYENNNNNDKNFLYISTFCSDTNFGQCGTFLMNTIKYVATLLNCDEIRLESVNDKNTKKFYKENGFKRISFDPVEYNHYYNIIPKDADFKPLDVIKGNVSIPWYMNPVIMKTPVKGGKYTKRKRTKRSRSKRSRIKRKIKYI
jgi:hypothetical protein